MSKTRGTMSYLYIVYTQCINQHKYVFNMCTCIYTHYFSPRLALLSSAAIFAISQSSNNSKFFKDKQQTLLCKCAVGYHTSFKHSRLDFSIAVLLPTSQTVQNTITQHTKMLKCEWIPLQVRKVHQYTRFSPSVNKAAITIAWF